jgi:hypothetical protein
MPRVTRKAIVLAVAATTAAGLVSTGTVGASAAPQAAAPDTNAVLHVKINDNGTHVSGPTSFAAGRVKLRVEAVGKDRGAEIIRLDSGYTFAALRDDLTTFGKSFGRNGPSKEGLKAFRHAVNNITAYGGLYAPKGGARHGTLLLPSAGQYVLFNDSGNLPKQPTYLSVGAPAGPQFLPETGRIVRVRAHENRFGGDDVLPAKGNVTFYNANLESPHFLVLAHVKEGTTRKQVIESFSSNGRPDFVRNGEQDIDFLSPHQAMTVKLNLPAGQYAEMCFFPDLKDGTPHAFMGMVKMVHLQ